eukprot:Skav217075  [mRNA]  locus=scaffold1308:47470:50399:- [translate_table: standard]
MDAFVERLESAVQAGAAPCHAVSDAVEDLGFGLYQLVPLFLTGGIFLAEGAEMLIMGSITSLLHRHWELDPVIRGGMVSIVFIGFSAGNFFSGQIGDQFGRRVSILVSYAMIAIFGFATACSGGFGPKLRAWNQLTADATAPFPSWNADSIQ